MNGHFAQEKAKLAEETWVSTGNEPLTEAEHKTLVAIYEIDPLGPNAVWWKGIRWAHKSKKV